MESIIVDILISCALMYNMDEKEDIMCTLPGRYVSHYLFTYCWSMVPVLILALYYQAFLALCHTYDQ
jgi:hypothetical protein